MTFYERYIKGETVEVYKEILALGTDAFLPKNLPDIEQVLTETFQRVLYNLKIIYSELRRVQYLFPTTFEYDFQRPLIQPSPDTEKLLIKLDKAVKPFGFVPLSLKMFYRIVGACNFGWDYDTNEDYLWKFADPIQVTPLEDVIEEMTDKEYVSDLREYFKDDGYISIELSADYLHKDNVSGGPAYSLKITTQQSVDAEFLNEEHNTTFIDYLRICFDNCGFPRITNPESGNDYRSFFDKVKPLLKPI